MMKVTVSNIERESTAINLTVVLIKRGYSVTTKQLKSGWRVTATLTDNPITAGELLG